MKFSIRVAVAGTIACFVLVGTSLSQNQSIQSSASLRNIECLGGTAAGYPCSEIELLSLVPIANMAGPDLSEAWGWHDEVDGSEYAILGHRSGVNIVDVTDPTNPVYIGEIPTPSGATPSSWRDVKTYQNYLYIVGDNAGQHGIQIFDLNKLRDIANPPQTLSFDAHLTTSIGVASAHNIAINTDTGFAYIVGDAGACGNGLYMLDLSDPLSPVFAGCHNDGFTGRAGGGYIHDVQCVVYQGPDTDHSGKEVCFASNETHVTIVDVEDKGTPVLLSSPSYPSARYVHQGWLTEDHTHFIQGDELDELQGAVANTRTLIWDVTDLDDPILVKEYFATTADIDHNLYVKGNLVFQANYTSGLRILNIADVTNPVEVGYFDTVPGTSGAFDGAWGAYPFLPSGNIVISSGNQGLFMVRASATVLSTDAPDFEVASVDIFPNPARTTATIEYVSETVGEVSVTLFDVAGRSIRAVHEGVLPAGQTHIDLDISGLSAGTYFVRVTRENATSAHKLTVVR